MYETMAVWQTIGDEPGVPAAEADYAELWRALDKVVYSRTLDTVSTPRPGSSVSSTPRRSTT